MNTHNGQQRNTFEVFLAVIIVSLVVAGIVLGALSIGALWSLVGVFFVAGVVLIGMTWIGVNLYSRYTEAALKRDTLRFNHVESVMKLGYLPVGRNVRYEPIQQIEAPADVPVSLQGITSEQLAGFKIHALNLLALSKQELGETACQVLPNHLAKANDYFKNVAIWSNAVRYLLANQIAHEVYREGPNGKKKIGTFLNEGTVGQAFEALNRE